MMDILELIDPACTRQRTKSGARRRTSHTTSSFCSRRVRTGVATVVSTVSYWDWFVDSYEGVYGDISREEQMVRWPVSQLWPRTPVSGQGQGLE